MGTYSIKPGEVMILREDTAYDHSRSDSNLSKGELLLTTDALVFSKKNFFGKVTDCAVYPLNTSIFVFRYERVKTLTDCFRIVVRIR